MTSFHALPPSYQRLWKLIRRFLPPKFRFFFEGSTQVPGQLWYQERKLLYETVRERRPSLVFEVGTWEGGGSTLFIAQALHDAGGGILHTIETDPERYKKAVAGFGEHLAHLQPFVQLHLGLSEEVYPELLSSFESVDLVFLDGAQDSGAALREFEMFEPYMNPGAVMMMHDWDNEKMAYVRKRVELDPRWQVHKVLGHPASVGFAVARLVA